MSNQIETAKIVLDFLKTGLAGEVEKFNKKQLEMLNDESNEYFDQEDFDENKLALDRLLNLEPTEETNVVLVRLIAEQHEMIGAQWPGQVTASETMFFALLKLGQRDKYWK